MRRPIAWAERNAEGIRREVQVSIRGRALSWSIRLGREEHWQRDASPTPADWERLLQTAENWYRRRCLTHDVLEQIKRLRLQADAAPQDPPPPPEGQPPGCPPREELPR